MITNCYYSTYNRTVVIAAIKAMYNWAIENEVIKDYPNLKAFKKYQ